MGIGRNITKTRSNCLTSLIKATCNVWRRYLHNSFHINHCNTHSLNYVIYYFFFRLTDWLICLSVCLLLWLIDWLIDWLTYWLIGWLIDWLIDWSIDWLIDWLIGWSIGWLIDSSGVRRICRWRCPANAAYLYSACCGKNSLSLSAMPRKNLVSPTPIKNQIETVENCEKNVLM